MEPLVNKVKKSDPPPTWGKKFNVGEEVHLLISLFFFTIMSTPDLT